MDVKANKALVLDFLQRLERGNIDRAVALLSEDATWWIGGKPEQFPAAGTKTKEQVRALLTGLVNRMTGGLRMTPSGITAEGARVAVEVQSLGQVANGRVYNNEYHFLFVVEGGLIRSVREYLDTLHAKAVFQA